MSVSSAQTLISPAATTHTMQRSNSHHGHKARTASHHHAHAHGHGHGHGHAKRRPSAHAAHTTGHLGTGRRGSEGDGGRKAIFQGLTMAAMDGKGKKTEERPGPKSSKSDSTVLKLTRSTSRSSNTSSQHGHTNGNGGRPRFKEKDSESSVVVVDDDGQEVELEEGEVGNEEWDDEDTPPKAKSKQDAQEQEGEEEEEEEDEESDKDPMSQAMRRTMSASIATLKTQSPEEMSVKPASITSPVSTTSRPEAPILTTRKTTGFGGKHPEPSPEPEVQEPLRRTQSVKELAAEAIGSERKATAQKLAMTDQNQNKARQNSGPAGPSRTRSTEGSGMPDHKLAQIETSPSYPFPRVLDPGLERTTSNGLRQSSGHSTPAERKTSNGLRHVPSNTSIRSTVSYRAPPHPLNSSLGHARTASTALSTDIDMRRSMHQPPLAPPVIYRVAAEGHTWDLLDSPDADTPPPPPMSRRESTSSQRSLRAIFQPTSSRMQQRSVSGPSQGTGHGHGHTQGQGQGTSQNGPIPNRRPTAMEAASAASKMHTTTNAALYHQSLGYSTSQSETAHLISRFLPAKPNRKAPWILTSDSEPGSKGITESEYKPAHDSLCRMMKNLGVPPKNSRNRNQTGSGFRKASKFTSSLLTVPVVGIIKSKNGPLRIERGGWGGKTPIELSIARCQAQRPRGLGK